MIGHDIKVTVIVIAGDKVRIGIDAPLDVEVHREEVYLEIQQANLRAASGSAEAVTGLTSVLHEQAAPPDGEEPAARAARPARRGQVSERGVSGSEAR